MIGSHRSRREMVKADESIMLKPKMAVNKVDGPKAVSNQNREANDGRNFLKKEAANGTICVIMPTAVCFKSQWRKVLQGRSGAGDSSKYQQKQKEAQNRKKEANDGSMF